jgi:hypothetical protein
MKPPTFLHLYIYRREKSWGFHLRVVAASGQEYYKIFKKGDFFMKQVNTESSVELKEGIMTNREMAEWFGCSMTTFTRNRPNWVKRLDEYCDYKLVRGGVVISNIRLSCYIKNKNYKIV